MENKKQVVVNVFYKTCVNFSNGDGLCQFSKTVSLDSYNKIVAFLKDCPLTKAPIEQNIFYTFAMFTVTCSNEEDTAADLNNLYNTFEVKDILVNGPATIVFWEDGTKTVVKCGPEDMHDLEKAVAMCFMKKALGGRSMKKIFDLAEDRAAEYESQFTRLSLKEMGYCLHDALSTILNQNPAKPCEGKIITDPDKIAEKMREERKEDKE